MTRCTRFCFLFVCIFYAFTVRTTHGKIVPTNGTIRSAAAFDDTTGTVVVGSSDYKIYGIAASDWELKWEVETGGCVSSSPAISPGGGTAYVGSADGRLYAVDTVSGSVDWFFQTGGDVASSPAVASDGTIYVGSNDHKLYAINPNGTKKWEYATGSAVIASPVIGRGGVVFIGGREGLYGNAAFFAISPEGGLVWKRGIESLPTARPAIGGDGTIYLVTKAAEIYAINQAHAGGWVIDLPGQAEASPVIAEDGSIIVGTTSGILYSVSRHGDILWQYDAGAAITESAFIVFHDGVSGGEPYTHIYFCAEGLGLKALNPDGTLTRSKYNGTTFTTPPRVITVPTAYSSYPYKYFVIGDIDGNMHKIHDISVPFKETGWSMFGKDTRNSSNQEDKPGTLQWKHRPDCNSPLPSIPAIDADGNIYISYRYGTTSLSPEGGVRWSTSKGNSDWVPPVIGHDGTIYACGTSWPDGVKTRGIIALTPEGDEKWMHEVDDFYRAKPMAIGADGTIFFGNRQTLRAISSRGKLKWTFEFRYGEISGAPSIGRMGNVHFGTSYDYLYSIKPNGDMEWGFSGKYYSCPAQTKEGKMYVGSIWPSGHNIYCIDKHGSKVWEQSTGGRVSSSPVIGADGTIYALSEDKYLYALHPNGSKKWTYYLGVAPATNLPDSPVVGDDGTIYVALQSKVFAINSDGTLQWEADTGASSFSGPPIMTPWGSLIVSTAKECLSYATSSTGLANSDWPMFQRNYAQQGSISRSDIVYPSPNQDVSLGVLNLLLN